MRIALLTHQFPGARLGGIGAYTLHNARALAAAGHEAHLFTLPLPADAHPALPPGVVLHEVTPQPPDSPPAACGELIYRMTLADAFAGHVLAAHRATPFDLVEGPEYEALALSLAQGEIPVVTHLHSGSAIARDAGNAPESAEQAMREALELELLAASDARCAPSHAVVRDTFHAYGIGHPPATLPTDILPLPFEPVDTPFTPPPVHGPILYINRLERLKGAHLLAQAALPFLKRHPEASIRFVGPDSMTAPTRNGETAPRSMADYLRAHLAPVASQVHLPGEASRETLARELAACTFVVLPSLRESYSYVACEALAAGRPVLVSSDTGAAEVIGDAGIVFPRGNADALAAAMETLWQNPARREELARRAYARAHTQLASAATMPSRVRFYETVIAHRRQHGMASLPRQLESLPRHFATRAAAARALCAGDTARAVRLLASTGVAWDPNTAATPGTRLLARLAAHARQKPVAFYLYGAGRHTERLLQEQPRWEAAGHRLLGLLDDHPRFAAAPTFRSLPVLSLQQATKKLGLGDVLILSTDTFEDQFFAQSAPLRAKGVAVYRLYGSNP
jgi:glycosyltransferase involved in cell wall biosynthesis